MASVLVDRNHLNIDNGPTVLRESDISAFCSLDLGQVTIASEVLEVRPSSLGSVDVLKSAAVAQKSGVVTRL